MVTINLVGGEMIQYPDIDISKFEILDKFVLLELTGGMGAEYYNINTVENIFITEEDE